mgnify:CR=1 FL=1
MRHTLDGLAATTSASFDDVSAAIAASRDFCDADSGTPVAQTVPLGTPLTIHVVTKTDQEFHLHGYDIEQEGTDVTFTFTADQAGEFELESHATETVVLNLTVEG